MLPRGPGPSLHHHQLQRGLARGSSKGGSRAVLYQQIENSLYLKSIVLDPTTVGVQVVRLGCYSGFWGNTATAMPQLVNGGNIQCLVTARKKPCMPCFPALLGFPAGDVLDRLLRD